MKLISLFIGLLLMSPFSFAQTNTESVNSTEVTAGGVSNAKMKAMSGSQSKYSFKMNLKYLGGTIKDPGSGDRPNPDSSLVIPKTELQGSVSGVYRFNQADTLAAGTGISFIEPEKDLQQTEMATPYLKYAKSFKKYGMDHISSAKYSYYTGRARKSGRDMHLTLSHYLAKPINHSRFTLGVDFGVGGSTFTRSDTDDLDWGWGLSPFVEYKIKDWVNATLLVVTGGSHYRLRDKVESDTIFAEMGLGFSVTDKVYINPVIAMYPEDPNLDTTTLSVDTIFSAF